MRYGQHRYTVALCSVLVSECSDFSVFGSLAGGPSPSTPLLSACSKLSSTGSPNRTLMSSKVMPLVYQNGEISTQTIKSYSNRILVFVELTSGKKKYTRIPYKNVKQIRMIQNLYPMF